MAAPAAPALPPLIPPYLQRKSALATNQLVIPARTGHRRTLLDVFVDATTPGFVDIKIGDVTLSRFFHNGTRATMISHLGWKFGKYGFLWYLSSVIPEFPFFNASQDENITILTDATVSRIDAYYADTTEGDVISRALPGGSFGTIHVFSLNLGNEALGATSPLKFDYKIPLLPTGSVFFTDEGRMAPNVSFDVHYLAFEGDTVVAGPGNESTPTRVHIFEEFKEVFTTETAEGLVVDPSKTELLFSMAPLVTFRVEPPFILKPNLRYTFVGERDVSGSGAAVPESTWKLFLIGIRRFL